MEFQPLIKSSSQTLSDTSEEPSEMCTDTIELDVEIIFSSIEFEI